MPTLHSLQVEVVIFLAIPPQSWDKTLTSTSNILDNLFNVMNLYDIGICLGQAMTNFWILSPSHWSSSTRERNWSTAASQLLAVRCWPGGAVGCSRSSSAAEVSDFLSGSASEPGINPAAADSWSAQARSWLAEGSRITLAALSWPASASLLPAAAEGTQFL